MHVCPSSETKDGNNCGADRKKIETEHDHDSFKQRRVWDVVAIQTCVYVCVCSLKSLPSQLCTTQSLCSQGEN